MLKRLGPSPRLGVIVGSSRRHSINRKLAQAIARLGAGAFDATFIRIDELPIYNQDQEQPVPDMVARFKVESLRRLLFVPEHSRSIPALLKNAIDWGAQPRGKTSWPGKPAAVTGASGGVISTAVAQQQLRAVLGGQGLQLMGGEAYIQFNDDLVDAEGAIADEPTRKFLKDFIDQFAAFAGKFAPVKAQRAA